MVAAKIAVFSAVALAVLALAVADVRSLYATPDGGAASSHHHQHAASQGAVPDTLAVAQDSARASSNAGLLQAALEDFQAVTSSGGQRATLFEQSAQAGAQSLEQGQVVRLDGNQRQVSAPLVEAERFPTLFQGDIRRRQTQIEESANKDGRLSQSSLQQDDGLLLSSDGAIVTAGDQVADVTITTEVTVDRFTTLTNLAYNSVPVTLTEFMKVTLTAPTFETVTTPVDDVVLVSRVPVSRTDTITVTDTNTGHQYATEVSTVLYTITHKLYDIRQQTVTSLVVQTQLVRPRVVSTRIETEFETQTQVQTVTNTIFLDPRVPRSGPLPSQFSGRYAPYQ